MILGKRPLKLLLAFVKTVAESDSFLMEAQTLYIVGVGLAEKTFLPFLKSGESISAVILFYKCILRKKKCYQLSYDMQSGIRASLCLSGKEPVCQFRSHKFDPCVGKIL